MQGHSMKHFSDAYRLKTPRSEALFKRAREVMPGGISHNIHFFPPYPFFVEKTKGSKIWDVDGNEYIDFWMGNYTHILGHRPRVVVQAIEEQLKEGIHWGALYRKQIEWAELIRELVPSAEMVRFCCSGTEATMYAIRLARGYTGKKTVLKAAGGWHGANSDLSLGIKMPYEREESLGLLSELQEYTKVIPFNDLSGSIEVIRQNKEDLAGIIVEPVIGEGGFTPAAKEYLQMLRSETRTREALLIFDEVISCFRVALGGAQERFNVVPDLTTLGKITGGGLPVGALVGRREIIEASSPEKKGNKWERVLIGGGTFSAHPLTAVAGLAMLRYLRAHRKTIYPLLESKGEKVRKRLQEAFDREGLNAAVTGVGSLFQTHFPFEKGVTLNSPQSIHRLTDLEKREIEFRVRMLAKGVHVMHGGGCLSTAHSDEDIEKFIKATRKVAREMKRE
jgi:glutamate-1-semialdehyde 2,1-aminomutase